MRRLFGVVVVMVLLVSTVLTGGVGAQEPPEPEEEPALELEAPGDGGAALALTFSDDVIIDDTGSSSSDLFLRDPGTTNKWQISGGFDGDFYLAEEDGNYRTYHQDGALGDSSFSGRNNVFINAEGVGGDIYLRARADQTIVQSFGNSGAVAEVLRLQANVPPQQVFDNTLSGAQWFFAMTADDQFKISRAGTNKVEAKFFDNGNLQIAGTLIQASDVNAKSGIELVDTAAVLDALAGLDIATWEYLAEPGVTHLGPTAQDFAAAFGLGGTDTGIAAVDSDGVALAAIQALAAENDQLAEQADELAVQNDALVERTDALAAENDRLRAEMAELRGLVEVLVAAS